MFGLCKYKIILKMVPLVVVMVLSGFGVNENKPLVVENTKSVLVYHLAGGELKDFHLKENALNPFFDPEKSSEGFHLRINSGKADLDSNLIYWDLMNSPIQKNNAMEFMMKADFLKEKITVKRFVTLPNERTGFGVKEEYFNYDTEGKSLFFDQYIPLSPDFISESKFHSNVEIKNNSQGAVKKKDMIKVAGSSPLNWLVIVNLNKGTMLGFVWKGNDFSKVEFGHKSAIPHLFLGESPSEIQVLESKGIKSKSYFCFLLPVPKDFTDVLSVQSENGQLVLIANAGKREFELGELTDF